MWKRGAWLTAIVSLLILAAILLATFIPTSPPKESSTSWQQDSANLITQKDMIPNLLSELAGLCAGTILALFVYYRIDRSREQSRQKEIKALIQKTTADHLHNILIGITLGLPIKNSGQILSVLVAQRDQATPEVKQAFSDLIKEVNALPALIDGETPLESLVVDCYREELEELTLVSEVIGQQATLLSANPDFVHQFLEFDNARRKLDWAIKFKAAQEDYPNQIVPAFREMLVEGYDLYAALLDE